MNISLSRLLSSVGGWCGPRQRLRRSMAFSHRRRVALLSVGMVTTAFFAASAQNALTFTTLYSFSFNDGLGPENNLVEGSDGNFYGTTYQGGPNQFGTVFQITPAGVLTDLYDFTNAGDGSLPSASLVRGVDGNFYGTCSAGGAYSNGTVFVITPAGVLTTLYSFEGNDGEYPLARLPQARDGNFYGTTTQGGDFNYGTVFQITSSGILTTLHSFAGGEGTQPRAGLVGGNGGELYGTTSNGGATNDGTVYQITTAGALTTLHSFANSDGSDSVSRLVLGSDGNFYGTTSGGGNNSSGTVFRITPAGVLTTLYVFAGSDGANPTDNLVEGSDGNFYGVTDRGGSDNVGTVFQITPAGVLTTLHSFSYFDGAYAGGLVLGTDGSFYGTTAQGGSGGSGTVFKLTVPGVTGRPAFLAGETALLSGVYYLAFPDGNYFGYYSFLANPSYIYHFDLGYEYVFDANDGQAGVYLYDFASSDFFYTSPTFPFPFLYDFGLNSVVYYYPSPHRAGHYNTDGVRYFYVFSTGQIITK